PDSIALMWLAARWRRGLRRGPRLIAVTVDHGLRTDAAREALDVKRLARTLELEHRTLRWTGAKPRAGVPAGAPEARCRWVARAAMPGIWRGSPRGWRAPMPRWKCWPMARTLSRVEKRRLACRIQCAGLCRAARRDPAAAVEARDRPARS